MAAADASMIASEETDHYHGDTPDHATIPPHLTRIGPPFEEKHYLREHTERT